MNNKLMYQLSVIKETDDRYLELINICFKKKKGVVCLEVNYAPV